ncbi:MAG: hypothetical protein JO182_26225, partial [Acidobacteriaceae bacterium]|nr:hypothetical protein [Acidobacteriaceae bacterium]
MKMRWSAFLLVPLAAGSAMCAQLPETPVTWGPFQTQGSTTVGYRFTDIGGRKQTFQQMFDLESGFRLFDFNLTGKAKDSSNLFADTFQLTASGLGGDPFPGGQFTVSKTNVYD